MKTVELKVPELGLFAFTRGLLGVGLGLLLAPKLDDSSRRAVGITLLAIGAITTIPFAAKIFCED